MCALATRIVFAKKFAFQKTPFLACAAYACRPGTKSQLLKPEPSPREAKNLRLLMRRERCARPMRGLCAPKTGETEFKNSVRALCAVYATVVRHKKVSGFASFFSRHFLCATAMRRLCERCATGVRQLCAGPARAVRRLCDGPRARYATVDASAVRALCDACATAARAPVRGAVRSKCDDYATAKRGVVRR